MPSNYPSAQSAPSTSSSSPLSLPSPPNVTLSSASLLSSTTAAGCRPCSVPLLIKTYPSTPSAPSASSSSPLSLHSPPHLTLSSASLLSSTAAAGCRPCFQLTTSSPHICSIALPSPSWRLLSLLPLFLCASALTLLPPYLLSYPCLPFPPLPSLPLSPLAPPLQLAAGPPLFSTPLLGFRCPICVAALLPLQPLVLVLWPLSSV
ncbi:unnamed protein product [Closterium sp. Naga37s-1]|nr:unnamed protein product [Closterium sp. Naga37s-1]